VIDSLTESKRRLHGLVVLGGEIVWAGSEPNLVRSTIDWDALKRQRISAGMALRIAPYPGPFVSADGPVRFIRSVAKSLLDDAKAHGFKLDEFQLDFDCAENNLGQYRRLLQALRPVIHPIPFVITTLPSWLDHPEFALLAREADSFVLQVHSVPPLNKDRRLALCDTRSAKKWVAKAAHLRMRFSVALPTYRCSAGYDSSGKLLSVAMDSVQPAWPPATRVLELAAQADDLAALISDWQHARPTELREIIWYRIPAATDLRNWRWSTLSAVMSGRKPTHHVDIVQRGENPIDLSIANTGEADEQLNAVVTAAPNGEPVLAADAVRGWTVDMTSDRAVFSTEADNGMQLSPGETRAIGWLRFERAASLRLELSQKQ
jgi:hypothetical protein